MLWRTLKHLLCFRLVICNKALILVWRNSMPKEDLLVIIRKLLRTDVYLDFLLALDENDLRTLIACIRERLDQRETDGMRKWRWLPWRNPTWFLCWWKRRIWRTKMRNYAPYSGRNPKSGLKIEVKPKRLPFFKVGKELKDRINLLGVR